MSGEQKAVPVTPVAPVAPATATTAARKPSFWRTARAVAWSFLGVRKDSEYQQDIEQLNPLHLMALGLLGGLLFVLVLIALVNWVVAK